MKQFRGTAMDIARQIINTSDGGYAISGCVYDNDTANDLAVIKFDSADNLEWMTRVGTENHDHGFSIAELTGGGYVVVGDAYLEEPSRTAERTMLSSIDIFIVQLSSTGALESATAHYDAGANEFGYAVIATSDGGFIVASDVPAWGWGQSDILLSKFNSSGFNEWSKLLGHWSYDTPYRIIGTSDGGYLISGNSTSPTRSIQAGLLKLDSSCNLEWIRCGGGTSFEYGYGVVQTTDGGFAQVATSWSYGSTNETMLIKYDSEGYYCEPDSQNLYTSDHSIMFEPVMVDVNTSLLVLETFTPEIVTLSRRDSLLCSGLNVEETALPMNSAISLHPNPFNASVAISAPGAERVEIVDISGRIVEVIEGDFSRESIWSPSEGTATGVYFVRARYTDGSSAEQRAVFMK
ncbi:MAG: T9SS type A sorting domain-containing protein [bacterium]